MDSSCTRVSRPPFRSGHGGGEFRSHGSCRAGRGTITARQIDLMGAPQLMTAGPVLAVHRRFTCLLMGFTRCERGRSASAAFDEACARSPGARMVTWRRRGLPTGGSARCGSVSPRSSPRSRAPGAHPGHRRPACGQLIEASACNHRCIARHTSARRSSSYARSGSPRAVPENRPDCRL
jgi:hypothetical protein